MKPLFIGLVFFNLLNFLPVSVYTINVQNLSGTSINLSAYQGKKIIVVEFSVANSSSSQLIYLDSLQKANSNIQVIAMPALDFSNAVSVPALQQLAASLQTNIVFTQPAYVKKTSASQHPLFSWLTHVSENTHFDADIQEAGQFFIINEQGTLYASLKKNTPKNVIAQIISQSAN